MTIVPLRLLVVTFVSSRPRAQFHSTITRTCIISLANARAFKYRYQHLKGLDCLFASTQAWFEKLPAFVHPLNSRQPTLWRCISSFFPPNFRRTTRQNCRVCAPWNSSSFA